MITQNTDTKELARRSGIHEREVRRLFTELRLMLLEEGKFRIPQVGLIYIKLYPARKFVSGIYGAMKIAPRRKALLRASPAFRASLNIGRERSQLEADPHCEGAAE